MMSPGAWSFLAALVASSATIFVAWITQRGKANVHEVAELRTDMRDSRGEVHELRAELAECRKECATYRERVEELLQEINVVKAQLLKVMLGREPT